MALHEMQVPGVTDGISFDALLGRHPGHRGAALLRSVRASKAPVGVPRNDFEERSSPFSTSTGCRGRR